MTPTVETAADAVADVLVVFGITGNLARVMTFRSLYRLQKRGLLTCPVVGVAVDDWTMDQLVQRARESIIGTGETLDEDVFDQFVKQLSYVQGDFDDAATYQRVADAIKGFDHPVFYLEVPPSLFATVIKGWRRPIGRRRRAWWSRSRSETTSPRRALAADLHQYIDESQLCRIDHYLGRWAWMRSCTCASPTRSSSRCGTAATSSVSRSTWRSRSASRIVALLRPGRSAA